LYLGEYSEASCNVLMLIMMFDLAKFVTRDSIGDSSDKEVSNPITHGTL